MRLFLRPLGPIQAACGMRQWLHRLFIYLFLFAEAHTLESTPLPHSRAYQQPKTTPLRRVLISISGNCSRLSDGELHLRFPFPCLLEWQVRVPRTWHDFA